MYQITFTQHSGLCGYSQQDALWNGEKVFQEKDLAVQSIYLDKEILNLVVADGLATSPQAELASYFVAENLGKVSSSLSGSSVRQVHHKLCDKYARGKTLGASTTLVAAQVSFGKGTLVNVGDSQAYLVSQNSFKQLSQDHTLLSSMLEQGEADLGEDYASIYDSLEHYLSADGFSEDFAIHYESFNFSAGDKLLLCSDGVTDVLSNEVLQDIFLQNLSSLEQIKMVHQEILQAGAPDNFSILLLEKK